MGLIGFFSDVLQVPSAQINHKRVLSMSLPFLRQCAIFKAILYSEQIPPVNDTRGTDSCPHTPFVRLFPNPTEAMLKATLGLTVTNSNSELTPLHFQCSCCTFSCFAFPASPLAH